MGDEGKSLGSRKTRRSRGTADLIIGRGRLCETKQRELLIWGKGGGGGGGGFVARHTHTCGEGSVSDGPSGVPNFAAFHDWRIKVPVGALESREWHQDNWNGSHPELSEANLPVLTKKTKGLSVRLPGAPQIKTENERNSLERSRSKYLILVKLASKRRIYNNELDYFHVLMAVNINRPGERY